MNVLKNFSIAIATAALCAVMVSPAAAQNRGYHNGWQNGTRSSQRTWNVRSLVDAAERSSNAFRDVVEGRDRNASNNRWGSNRDRYFNDLTPSVQRLDEAFERLRGVADNNRYRAGSNEMSEVMTRAREVDRYMRGNSFGWNGSGSNRYGNGNGNRYGNGNGNGYGNNSGRYQYAPGQDLRSRWNNLKRDINALARAYGVAPLSTYR